MRRAGDLASGQPRTRLFDSRYSVPPWVAQQDPFNRSGRHVLPVDAHPIGSSARQIDPALLVPVGQIARPVEAVPHPFGVRLRVVVIPGEIASAGGVYELADRLVGVQQPAGLVEACRRALADRLAVVDGYRRCAFANRPAGHSRFTNDVNRVLSGAEAILDDDAEPPAELADVFFVGFVAESSPQRILGVVATFPSRQDIGEGFADVVHVRGSVPADVVEKT